MQCPVCKVDLVMTDRQGVEIDYCPRCRGVWLDRGELDKIIERSASLEHAAGPGRAYDAPFYPEPREDHHDRDREREYERREGGRYDRYDKDRHYKGRKRKSLLEDLFDFD